MMKKILIILITVLTFIAPVQISAQDYKTDSQHNTEQELNAVTITANESTVMIKNASQQVLEVYNLAGVKVASVRIDSESKTLTFSDLPKGCYILKIGKTVRKVYLK